MSERTDQIHTFLDAHGWADAIKLRVAGDMSSRRYWRLKKAAHSAILMDADAPMSPFVEMTEWLAGIGLSVPQIHAAEASDGLILMEDFGDTSLKQQ